MVRTWRDVKEHGGGKQGRDGDVLGTRADSTVWVGAWQGGGHSTTIESWAARRVEREREEREERGGACVHNGLRACSSERASESERASVSEKVDGIIMEPDWLAARAKWYMEGTRPGRGRM